MANVNIRTSECAWAQVEIEILGRSIKGLRAFEFSKKVEKEHIYGSGNEPLDIQSGNKSYTGSITVLGFEADTMNATARESGYEDITDIPHNEIVITAKFQKEKKDPQTFYTISGVSFTENTASMEQNAKTREIQLPFLAMKIEYK
ncbi:MAG: hypothetical protein LIO93_08450 [Bacteroidales bacterium]|nr:hypothetical protein [Bacteroidales bacterium]